MCFIPRSMDFNMHQTFCILFMLHSWMFTIIEAYGHEHVHIRVHVPHVIHNIHHKKKTYIHQRYPPTIIHRHKEILDDDRDAYLLPGEDDFSSTGTVSEDYPIIDRIKPHQEKYYTDSSYSDIGAREYFKGPSSHDVKYADLLGLKGTNIIDESGIGGDYDQSDYEIYDTSPGRSFYSGVRHRYKHHSSPGVVVIKKPVQVIDEEDAYPWPEMKKKRPSAPRKYTRTITTTLSDPSSTKKRGKNRFKQDSDDYLYDFLK